MMKTLVSVSLVVLVFCLGLAWWVRTDGPAADGRADAVRNNEVSPAVPANRVIARGGQTPPTWVPTDAERVDDRGAFLTWVPTDAERDDDRGAFLTWVPTDAERDDDQGALLTWTASDAERDDDIGVQVRGGGHRG
jgi:hypothetical protein